jgi:hypothetical protein
MSVDQLLCISINRYGKMIYVPTEGPLLDPLKEIFPTLRATSTTGSSF